MATLSYGAKVDGVGKDAPTKTNAHGGKQSDSPYRTDLLQPLAMLHLAKIMKYGAEKYGDNNWHAIPTAEHLNHAMTHLFAHLAGDTQDDHLGHAAWRVVSALEQVLSGRDGKLQQRVERATGPTAQSLSECPASLDGFGVGDHVKITRIGAVGTVVAIDRPFLRVLEDDTTRQPGGWLPSSCYKLPKPEPKPVAPPQKPACRARVYIAGPISTGDLAANIRQATDAFIALAKAGYAPLCPHWSCFSGTIYRVDAGTFAYASPQPNELKHADWLAVDLAWVSAADAVLRLPGDSAGADQEVQRARVEGIPVFFSIDDLRACTEEQPCRA